MTKYYINAKTIRVVLDSNSPKDAAKQALYKFGRGKMPSSYTEVGIKGFNDDYLYDTYDLLKELYNEHGNKRPCLEYSGSCSGHVNV
jgi:hypothetical protein